MGSRADHKLKEIDELRSSLERKLGELESRFPIAGLGRKAAAALAGGSAAGTAATFALRRLRRRKPKRAKGAVDVAPVVVNVIPKGVTLVVAAGIAVWAGAKVYETYLRTKASSGPGTADRPPAVVRPIPDAPRQSGSGT